jgi:hypothetical protein
MKAFFPHRRGHVSRGLILSLVVLGLCACASAPQTVAEGTYLDRAQAQQEDGVRVTAAVPSADESKQIFGKPLYKSGVQPVWLKIENFREETISFLPVGLDPAYFTATEVASIDIDDQQLADGTSLVSEKFFQAGISLAVPPGETRSGFIYSQLDEGTKSFNVDIIGSNSMTSFTFFIPVPGLRVDHYNVDWKNLYPGQEPLEFSRAEFIEATESATCCVTDKAGQAMGDPLNLVIIGSLDEVYNAFIRAGWDETETIHSGSMWKTFKSFVGGGEYRYSPVSALYFDGRPQDVAFQKARSNIHERNHLRLWLTNYRFQGKPVWIGQISRDIGVRFSKKTITTHKIDPNVDETREYLLEDLAYSQALEKFGYVGGVGPAPIGEPRFNLGGDPYFTDGYRIVLWVSDHPIDILDVGFEYLRNSPLRISTP